MDYEEFCQKFSNKNSPRITDITKHKFLQKFFNVFLFEEEKFDSGVFVIDPLGIYTPVQNNDAGVVCFKKLPFNNQSVYALHDGNNTEYMKYKKFFIIFAGVIETDHGFKFINDFSLYPASTLNVTNIKEYYLLKDEAEAFLTDESSSDDESDDEPTDVRFAPGDDF